MWEVIFKVSSMAWLACLMWAVIFKVSPMAWLACAADARGGCFCEKGILERTLILWPAFIEKDMYIIVLFCHATWFWKLFSQCRIQVLAI
jgi:hypothetical protein